MSYYNTITELYDNYKRLSIYYSYKNRIKTYELLLKIFSYNNNDDTKFDIFYKKHMANFKLTHYYYIYHIQVKLFNSFINSEDFINTIGAFYINDENFYIEINRFILFNRLI